jgi:[ribosomal protein S5]-alanine N-acetyltransferase
MTLALALPSPLRDGEVALLPVGTEVAALVLAASHDPEITRWTQVPQDLTLLDAGLITSGWTMPSTTTARFQVSLADVAPIGMVTVWINAEDEAEVGYWLLATARGRGIGRRAVRLLCTWAFEVCGLERLQLATLPGNVASERVAQACGFHRKGTLMRDVKGVSSTLDLWVRAAGKPAVQPVSAP